MTEKLPSSLVSICKTMSNVIDSSQNLSRYLRRRYYNTFTTIMKARLHNVTKPETLNHSFNDVYSPFFRLVTF